jgi:hypothetical protein
VTFYTLVFVVLCLRALTPLVAVIRTDKKDLLGIIRVITGRKDDGDGPPTLPAS